MIVIEDIVKNIPNEILFVGSIYKNPDLIIEYAQCIKSKYDFFDEATRWFYDVAELLYTTRTQTFNKITMSSFVAEDNDRLVLYKKFGGWSTIEKWIKLSILEDFKNYYNILKKYSLLREYQRNGFNISNIMNHNKFEQFTAMDIYRLIRSKADRIHTVILTNDESEILNSNIKNTLLECMRTPDIGIEMPFPILYEVFRGLRKSTTMAVGMLSNAGKSRFMVKLIAYIALVLKQKVFVMLNEMTVQELRYALITTVINNPEFQNLHNIKIKKPEREFTLGLYKDKNGELIKQKVDDKGNFLETYEEYVKRVAKESGEFNKIMEIADWIESETQEYIYTKDLKGNYDDKTLEFEIRKAHLIHKIDYYFYDTFKQDINNTGDWAAMKTTATKLSELNKEIGMFGYLSIQLTDDTNIIEPDKLSSSNVANCKNIKHILDSMILFKEINKNDYFKYQYLSYTNDWGEPILHDLKQDKRYYCGCVDKNRAGRKPKVLIEVDLDYNTWIEVGELVRR